MSRIKLMHIISDTNFGGAGQYVKTILDNLPQTRYQCQLVVPKGSQLKSRVSTDQIFEIDGIADRSLSLRGIIETYRLIKRESPEIIHAHGALSGRIAAQLYGVRRIIYTKHTLSQPSSGVKRLIKHCVNKLLRADVIAVSEEVKRNLLEEGIKAEHIVRIHNSILPKSPLEFEPCTYRRIVLVGRLERIKGHHYMLEVVKRLKSDANIPFKVYFVGAGSLESDIGRAIQDNNLPIEMTGHVDAIDAIYQMADIVVNTSESEALPFSVLEAMNTGRPVVAFDLPSIREVIQPDVTGFLVPPFDVDTFAKRLKTLMESENLMKSMGLKGNARVHSNFNLETMMKEMDQFYREGL